MKRATLFCLAAAALLGAGPTAQASQIDWSYQFQSGGHELNFITTGKAFGVVILPGTGGANDLHTGPDDVTKASTQVLAFSTATAAHPQTVSDLPFAINLKLTDQASGLSEYVSFGGSLKGNLWNNGSTLSPTFFGPLTKTADIDQRLFTVTFDSFTPPAGFNAPGQFVFDVKVHHNPEPSTLVLAGLGAPLFSLALRRRRLRRGQGSGARGQ
jgi:hypothetical protein